MKMLTTGLFWAVDIQLQAKNTVTALHPFAAVGTGITYQRTTEQAWAWPENQSPDLSSQLQPRHGYTHLDQLMMKTQVPTHLDRSVFKLDMHKSATPWGYTQGLSWTAACQKMCWRSESEQADHVCAPEGIKKASGILGFFRKSTTTKSSNDIFSPCSALVMHVQMLITHTEHPGVIWWQNTNTGAPFTQREAERAGAVPPEEEKPQEGLTNVFKHPTEENKEDWVRLSPVVSREMKRRE